MLPRAPPNQYYHHTLPSKSLLPFISDSKVFSVPSNSGPATIPTTSPRIGISTSTILMHDVDAQQSRNEEEDGGQEEECKVGFEFVAAASMCDAVPVPDTATVGTNVLECVSALS